MAVVRRAGECGRTIRVAGTGHSFNSIACTEGTLLDLSGYRGVLRIDRQARTVTLRSGTLLADLCERLDEEGLTLPVMGTLAEQTVGGMISTGNHGTGWRYQQFGCQVTGLRMVTADGETRECSAQRDPDLFRAARTALGTLGVITEVTMACVPAFRVEVAESSEPAEALLERFSEWICSADYVSFSLKAWSDSASTRVLARTGAPVSPRAGRYRLASTLDEVRCAVIGQAGRVDRSAVPWLSDRGLRLPTGPVKFTDSYYRAATFWQPVKQLAMESAVPLANVPAAVREVQAALRRAGVYSPYSLTVRIGAADDIMLSPAYGRATGYLNLTVPRAASYLELHRIAEAVFEAHDGRPHWGKAHTATAASLAARYPEWRAAASFRAKLDPDGVFSNDYIRRVLGGTGRSAA